MVLETLSHSPRVFSVFNFMDDEEADQIIEDALGMTQEDYRLKVREDGVVSNLDVGSGRGGGMSRFHPRFRRGMAPLQSLPGTKL